MNYCNKYGLLLGFLFFFLGNEKSAAQYQQVRNDMLLQKGWTSIMSPTDSAMYRSFHYKSFNDSYWKHVSVPHNWDDYYGYRRMSHGNLHGYAWYRKIFKIANPSKQRRYFLWFEGVSSYATVWVNGKKIGQHAGGRTSFTLDVSDAIYYDGKSNIVAVRADHPANIQDLPWVCGGCSDERGFSEGSQPMGIFRPVHLIETNMVRVEPFGVHIWNAESKLSEKSTLLVETEIKNYNRIGQRVTVTNTLLDADGNAVGKNTASQILARNTTRTFRFSPILLTNPKLWSLEKPYLYKVKTEVLVNGKLMDSIYTDYGIRYVSWPVKDSSSHQFLLNGKPVFINGIAEYEHLLGGSHAFSPEEIFSRVAQIKAAGFNAFRDAHQPHNLRYQYYWNHDGILWWPQFSAHIWYNTPAFKNNFKKLLRDWIKERRNDPSVVTWGLQNESHLPADFVKECMDIIHEMDPTSVRQRMINTCNGGEGTDWDVPQNWSGTYGGDPEKYGDELKKQLLVGEYGAWRSIDLHKTSLLAQNGKFNEEDMTSLMEFKVRKAEEVKDSVCGQFFWLYNSHDNPGRVQGGEGMREIDRIGPINYKGMLTPWGEPLDVYYMYRSNYANKINDPMVYIVSHSWPDRLEKPGKISVSVYSNCDEVELFNDTKSISYGKKKRNPLPGHHFEWDDIAVNYNVLYAVGYVNGKAVAKDIVLLHHLPQSPNYKMLQQHASNITKANKRFNYIYRVNCGGDDYTDENGNVWLADQVLDSATHWGSTSWASRFKELNPVFASQREMNDPIAGTVDWPLFQSFRYGRQELSYTFPLADGDYSVELYFVEPWLGKGGEKDCKNWRLFDIAANGVVIEKKLDIWKEVGYAKALKKVYNVQVKGGKLVLSFPNVEAGQAVISAIAIASAQKPNQTIKQTSLFQLNDKDGASSVHLRKWLTTTAKPYSDGEAEISELPYFLYGADWVQMPHNPIKPLDIVLADSADVYIGIDASLSSPLPFMGGFENANGVVYYNKTDKNLLRIYKKRMPNGAVLNSGDYNGNLLVAAQPITNILPAYDLKEATVYKVDNAKYSNTAWHKLVFNKKDIVQLKSNEHDTLTFTIHTGVADIYSLSLKYANPSPNVLKGTLVMVNATGAQMFRKEIEFDNTKPGKWGLFETNTESMINAGEYQLRLITDNASELIISGLEVR